MLSVKRAQFQYLAFYEYLLSIIAMVILTAQCLYIRIPRAALFPRARENDDAMEEGGHCYEQHSCSLYECLVR
jgi:hypothetical protein